ncbi:MAG: macrolide ABC transporter ATP-binding protein [Candidatus Poribacteria bacterium]|nr:MAG: macrolide ABC transporter ATP-binding protein [Candidatus Poribacteria bacterium]
MGLFKKRKEDRSSGEGFAAAASAEGPDPRALIHAIDIVKIYEMGDVKVHALRGVTLKVTRGEMVAIMGPSGSGKSTMMDILGCLAKPTSGTYYLDGDNIEKVSDNRLAEIRNKKIGFVFQSFNLLPRMSALHNVELPLIYAGVPKRERRRRAIEALEAVGLGDRLHHKSNELSGGQIQRVAIARALVTRPAIIFADEPTGNLDSRTSEEIMQLFEELHRQGNTILLVTHEPDIAAHCQRIIRLRDGKIESDEWIKEMSPLAKEVHGERPLSPPPGWGQADDDD